MAWPETFASYSQYRWVVNLEILSLLAMAECQLAVPFINSFLLGMLGIPIFMSSVLLALVLVQHRNRKSDRKFIVPKKTRRRNGRNEKSKVNLRMKEEGIAVKLCIIIVQLLYPN